MSNSRLCRGAGKRLTFSGVRQETPHFLSSAMRLVYPAKNAGNYEKSLTKAYYGEVIS